MLVHNDADRYLERVLKHASLYIEEAIILDYASEDNTVEVCKTILSGSPLTLVSNPELKHLGWMKEEDRLFKYNRYKQLDPGAIYGIA